MEKDTKTTLDIFKAKATAALKRRRQYVTFTMAFPSTAQDGEEPLKIKFRTLSDAEVNECVAKNDEDDPNIGDKWAMYLSAVEPSLKDLANAMKESGDISYPMEIFEMFQRHEITEASTIIMEKSGVIGKDKVTVVDKAIENLKN
ncbi:hypothetical protein DWW67_06000 [Coprobacillus sp. AF16-47]|jgi:hypothetical protein|nr:hypothetical protein DWW67_06000 [Coprobacillus sp. AF16-47]DAJ79493.1 MAG TPA: hypothetical protein [Caudoviricetes sp.]